MLGYTKLKTDRSIIEREREREREKLMEVQGMHKLIRKYKIWVIRMQAIILNFSSEFLLFVIFIFG